MKRYIFLIIILTAISRFGFAQTAQQAAAAYANKNYPEAIELYQQLSKEQGVSSELYYNLGNAYYPAFPLANKHDSKIEFLSQSSKCNL